MTAVVGRLSPWRRGRARNRHRRTDHTRHRRQLPVLVIGAWTVFCAAQLAFAYGDARQGMRQVTAARRSIGSEVLEEGRLEARLRHAHHLFHRAHRRAGSPVLAPLRAVPVLGRQVRSVVDLTAAASRVAEVGAMTVDGMGSALIDGLSPGVRVATLRRLADQATIAETALTRVPLGGRVGLVAPLRRRWAVLEHDLAATRATLRTAAEGFEGMARVLEGPRRYLLLAANNAEMRAGSGMFLSIGTIVMAGGSVQVTPLRPSGDLTLPGAGVEEDGDLAARWGWLDPGREWRNLGTTPRFDVTAPLAIRMWERMTGERLDGALALDVPLLKAVLGATGPVPVGSDVVDETTVTDRLLRDQYQGHDVDDPQAARREELGSMLTAVVGALERGDYSPWRLVAGFARAGRGRHVLAWSADPEDQRMWERAGVTGALEPRSLAVSILNRGGNKLDPFLDVSAALDTRRASEGTEVTVRVDVANHAPGGLSPYIAGPHPRSGVGEGVYLGIVAFNLPGAATDIAIDGGAEPVSSGPDGPSQVVAVPLQLTRGDETTVTVQFRLPSGEQVEVVPSARVPPVRWEAGPHRWVDVAPKVVSWRWE